MGHQNELWDFQKEKKKMKKKKGRQPTHTALIDTFWFTLVFKFLSLIFNISLATINPVKASVALYNISCSVFNNLASAKSSPIFFFLN